MKPVNILPKIVVLMVLSGILITPASVMAHGIEVIRSNLDVRPAKVGVMVVALLPRDTATAAKQEIFNKMIKKTLPTTEVVWARLDISGDPSEAFIKDDNQKTIQSSLVQMDKKGITHLAILPLSIIPSEAYAQLVWVTETIRQMPTSLRKINLAKPFFGAPNDIENTCRTVLDALPAHDGKGEKVVIFFEEKNLLGDYIYPGIQYYMWKLDQAVFVGTAGATPGLGDVLNSLKKVKTEKVFLVPFLPYQSMELTTWAKRLQDNGYQVEQIEESLIGHEKVADIMIQRLKNAIAELFPHKKKAP